MFGEWNVKVNKGLPQKLASEFDDVMSTLLGAKYTPCLYVGSQEVNGTNHGILCEQEIVGSNVKNIVLVTLNENYGDFTVVDIKTLLRQGQPIGGFTPSFNTDISAENQKEFDECIGEKLGCAHTLCACLGEKVVKGVNKYFLVETSLIVNGEGKHYLDIYCVNSLTHAVRSMSVLDSEEDLGFSLGCPLGEWP